MATDTSRAGRSSTSSHPSSPTSIASSGDWPLSNVDVSSSNDGDFSAPPRPPLAAEEAPLPPSPTTPEPPVNVDGIPPLPSLDIADKPSPSPDSSEAKEEDEQIHAELAEEPVWPSWSRSRSPSPIEQGMSPVEEHSESKVDVQEVQTHEEEVETVVSSLEKAAEALEVLESFAVVAEKTATQSREEPQHDDDVPDAEESTAEAFRIAFVVTRPTLSGENETIAISHEITSTVTASIGEKSALPTPVIQIDTTEAFLASTSAFVDSPTHTDNAAPNSAISPTTKTSDFFFSSHPILPPPRPVLSSLKTADFFTSSASSNTIAPPRPLTATVSDVDSEVEATFERAVVVPAGSPSQDKFPRRFSQVDEQSPASHSNTASTDPLISPLPQPPSQRRPRHASSRSISRQRHVEVQSSSSESEWEDGEPPVSRAPPTRSRTIVSAVEPPRRRAPLIQQPRPHPRQQPSAAPRAPQSTSPPLLRRRQQSAQEPSTPSSLDKLIEDVKSALKQNSTAYYALKGVLVEHEEQRRALERIDASSAGERYETRPPPLQQQPYRNHHLGAGRVVVAERNEEQRPSRSTAAARPAPAPRYPLTQTSDEDSEVEQGRENVVGTGRRGSARDQGIYSYKQPSVPRVSPTDNFSTLLQQQQPAYPPHLSAHAHLPVLSPSVTPSGLVRPIPIRPLHPVNNDVPSAFPSPFPSPRGETLTVAQAAQLAEKLGHESQAEELRSSGLRGKDKISKLVVDASGAGFGPASVPMQRSKAMWNLADVACGPAPPPRRQRYSLDGAPRPAVKVSSSFFPSPPLSPSSSANLDSNLHSNSKPHVGFSGAATHPTRAVAPASSMKKLARVDSRELFRHGAVGASTLSDAEEEARSPRTTAGRSRYAPWVDGGEGGIGGGKGERREVKRARESTYPLPRRGGKERRVGGIVFRQ